MNVQVQPLIGTCISTTISTLCGPLLSLREQEVMDYCQSLGEVYTGYVDGEFICCWGLIPPTFMSDQAYLWMWAPEPLKHQFVFIRQSQIQVQRMLEHYNRIVGHCEVKSHSAQRWLKWLGAEFGSPKDGAYPFTIERRG